MFSLKSLFGLPRALQVTPSDLTSIISFLPRPDQDYGQMICMASNEIGRMIRPCIFTIAAAGRPESPQDCLVLNQTSESLSVRCEAGYDGGLTQRFVAELREAAGRRLLRNLTEARPRFSLRHLPAGLRLRLELYAVNSRGRSRAVVIEGLTLQAAEKRVSNDAVSPQQEEISMTPVVGVLIGGVLSLLLIAAGVVACLKSSHAARKSEAPADLVTSALPVKVEPALAPGPAVDTEPPAYRPVVSSETRRCETDDRNPDVVPSKREYGVPEMSGAMCRRAEDMKVNVFPPPIHGAHYEAENGHTQSDQAASYSELTLPRHRGGYGRERPAGDWDYGRGHDGAVLYATLRRGRGGAEACSSLTRAVRPDPDQESVV